MAPPPPEGDPKSLASATQWFARPQRNGRLRGVVYRKPSGEFRACINALGGPRHADLGVFSQALEGRQAVEEWLAGHDAYPDLPANHHVWGVVSSGSAARAGGVAEVHQCQHESCGKFRVISKDVDEDKLYTYRQLMAVYPDIEWD